MVCCVYRLCVFARSASLQPRQGDLLYGLDCSFFSPVSRLMLRVCAVALAARALDFSLCFLLSLRLFEHRNQVVFGSDRIVARRQAFGAEFIVDFDERGSVGIEEEGD